MKIDAADLPQNQFFLNLQMDGKQVSGFMQVSNVPELAGGYRAFADQNLLEGACRKYISMAPAIMKVAMAEEGMPPEAESFMNVMVDLYADLPLEWGQSLHPASYWGIGLRYFTCRQFQMKDGVVGATLTADFQKGSGFRKLADTIVETMVATGEVREDELESLYAMIPLLNLLIDQARLVMRFDEKTGIPLALDVDFKFNIRGTIVDIEPVVHLKISYRGNVQIPESAEEVTFLPQPEAAESMDVTGFIQIGMNYLLNLAEGQEAEEDMDF